MVSGLTKKYFKSKFNEAADSISENYSMLFNSIIQKNINLSSVGNLKSGIKDSFLFDIAEINPVHHFCKAFNCAKVFLEFSFSDESLSNNKKRNKKQDSHLDAMILNKINNNKCQLILIEAKRLNSKRYVWELAEDAHRLINNWNNFFKLFNSLGVFKNASVDVYGVLLGFTWYNNYYKWWEGKCEEIPDGAKAKYWKNFGAEPPTNILSEFCSEFVYSKSLFKELESEDNISPYLLAAVKKLS